MASEPPHLDWRPHPWHGLSVGPEPPAVVTAFIEITPYDVVKYEIDKETGYLRLDRPQRGASSPPALYGFIPRTFCGDGVASLNPGAEHGDGDPLDLCVLADRPGNRADIALTARVVGGIGTVDGGKADDKIIGILANDPLWGGIAELHDLPEVLVDRLVHYFCTYKSVPGATEDVALTGTYGKDHAHRVIEASVDDYATLTGRA